MQQLSIQTMKWLNQPLREQWSRMMSIPSIGSSADEQWGLAEAALGTSGPPGMRLWMWGTCSSVCMQQPTSWTGQVLVMHMQQQEPSVALTRVPEGAVTQPPMKASRLLG